MNILVLGTWKEDKAKKFDCQLKELGKILAYRNHTLVTSPSSGVQGLSARYYKENNGKSFIGYYPDLNLMKKINEKVLVKPDIPIYTNENYPVRNIKLIEEYSQGVIAITGGGGTFSEIYNAINDFNLPIAYYRGSSEKLDKALPIFGYENNSHNGKVLWSQDIKEMVEHLEKYQ